MLRAERMHASIAQRELLKQVVATMRRVLDEEPRHVMAHFVMGNAFVRLDEWRSAIQYLDEHLRLAEEAGEAPNRVAFQVLGICYKNLGEFRKAVEFHEKDLRIAKEVGDRAGEARAYCNLGVAYKNLGKFTHMQS